MSKYWLSKWLDYHDINSEEEAKKALLSPTVTNDLRRYATKSSGVLRAKADTNFSVVAGRGIDLSGQLDCSSDTCRIRQVNQLFGHVWHYFDQIIVQDGIVHEVIYHWEDTPEITQRRLLSHIKVLLYLRSIGAENLVDFRIKQPACTEHWQLHAEEAGLSALVNQIDDLADYLLSGATVTFEEGKEGGTLFRFSHPQINPQQVGELLPSDIGQIDGSLQRKAAVLVARGFLAHLTSDVAASNSYHAALGSVNSIHDLLLRRWRGITPADVLMNLRLPILSGLKPWDLIDIRREEGQYFANFRDSLLQAIKERLKLSEYDSANEVAEEIRLDLIEPQLNQISLRLKAAQNTLSKKSAIGLVLGSLGTTCGILAGLAPEAAVAGGTTMALGCTGAATAKYLDDTKDISLNDMFFLWKAREHTPH
jgi:hypothetical protein